MEKVNLLVICGSTRPNNNSTNAAKFVLQEALNNNNFETKFIDVANVKLIDDGNSKDPNYSKLVTWADAFFIVTPEYNHGVPGGLKRLLDSEPNSNYEHKAVAMAGVSTGSFGGIRGVESLIPILKEFGLSVTRHDVYFSHVDKLFTEKNEEMLSKQEKRIESVLEELLFLSNCLKWGRKNLISKTL